MNNINEYYLKQFMIDCEDGLVNFMLYKLSESFVFIKNIGYYYIVTNESITFNKENFQKRLRSNFLYLKYLYENTKNNNIEKKMAVFVFSDIFRNHPDMIKEWIHSIKDKKSFEKDDDFNSKKNRNFQLNFGYSPYQFLLNNNWFIYAILLITQTP